MAFDVPFGPWTCLPRSANTSSDPGAMRCARCADAVAGFAGRQDACPTTHDVAHAAAPVNTISVAVQCADLGHGYAEHSRDAMHVPYGRFHCVSDQYQTSGREAEAAFLGAGRLGQAVAATKARPYRWLVDTSCGEGRLCTAREATTTRHNDATAENFMRQRQ